MTKATIRTNRNDAAVVALTVISRGLNVKLAHIDRQERRARTAPKPTGKDKLSPARSYWLGKRHGIESAMVTVELAVSQLLK